MKARQTFKFVVLALSFVLAACGKNDGGGSSPSQVATVPTYGYVNGACVNQLDNSPVAYTYCQNSGYSYQGSVCIQTSTGQHVDPVLCQQTGYGNNGYWNNQQWNNGQLTQNGWPTQPQLPYPGPGSLRSGVCFGIYYFSNPGQSRVVTCRGSNCRGWVMYSQYGQPIACQ